MPRVSTDGLNWVECKGQSQVESHFDDVEIQAALDSLPTTGGTVYLGGGIFTLAKQIARAIDNVTIRGQGITTRINFNGSTAVISAGSQAGWVLCDFNTDGGNIDVASATNCLTSYWAQGTRSGEAGVLRVEERTFVETAGTATYTGLVNLPANATVLDVRWSNQALWTAGTSATLNVGDADDLNGYIEGVDLLAAPIADVNGAGGISSFLKDTGTGAYKGLTKYSAATHTIQAVVVAVGTGGTTGRSRLTVIYAVPVTSAASRV
jgi:hypothetical protein